MASGTSLRRALAVRMLLMGFPGSGKTGALASLANAGFKLRIIDLDGNPESLLQYVRPDMLDNIDIVTLEDIIEDDPRGFTNVKGVPTAFTRAMALLDHWRYRDPEGSPLIDPKTNEPRRSKAGEILLYRDLGRLADWGPDTILVSDGLTGLAQAAFRRARATLGKVPGNITRAVWNLGTNDIGNYINKVTDGTLRCHSIMISHLRLQGPKAEESDDSTLTKTIKQAAAEHIPTRYYPSGLTAKHNETVSGDFPYVMRALAKGKKRILTWQPTEEVDLKLPLSAKAAETIGELIVEDGLLKVFRALGAEPPVR